MFINKLVLENYANFEHIELNFSNSKLSKDNVSILIGENGAGKSNIIEAIATILASLVHKLRNDTSSGDFIQEDRIHIRKNYTSICIEITYQDKNYSWKIVGNRPGQKSSEKGNIKDVSVLASCISEKYTQDPQNVSLPLIAYYTVDRNILNIPKQVEDRQDFSPIAGYEGSIARGIDFQRFFAWFKNADDIRNEILAEFDSFIPYLKLEDLHKGVWLDALDRERLNRENPNLAKRLELACNNRYTSVTKAISTFVPNVSDLRLSRSPALQMRINKNGEELDILQLSQGERSLLALVADIAYRLAIMNPAADNPLEGEGIILIDEIDLHLHPAWQRTIVRNLQRTFPNCQFILTTHSPLVVSDPQNVQVFLLQDTAVKKLDNLYGMDIEQVLLEVMDTPLRHEPLQKKIDDMLDAIQTGNFDRANQLYSELLKVLPENHRELMRARLLMKRMKIIAMRDNKHEVHSKA